MNGSCRKRQRESGPGVRGRGRGWGIHMCPLSSGLQSPASATWANRSQGHGSPGDASRDQHLGHRARQSRAGQESGREMENIQDRDDETEREEQNLRKMGLEREMKFKDGGRDVKVLGQGRGDRLGKGRGHWLLIFPVFTGRAFS